MTSFLEKWFVRLILLFWILLFGGLILYQTPIGRVAFNSIDYVNRKIDEATNYKTKQTVEDTCRSMISSYHADVLMYKQYRSSESETKQEWAEQARMRANMTAASYNEYVLKNRYVWADNVPHDIQSALPYIED